QYPVMLRIVTEARTYPWVRAEQSEGRIVFLFNTELPPLTIIAYPADAPEEEAGFAVFDGASLTVTALEQPEA
ncbi:MAG: hypothetical protein Q4C13_07265, partial [Clostridia bacterium]|nr:hypothetical protein [Clostridia bacterium]